MAYLLDGRSVTFLLNSYGKSLALPDKVIWERPCRKSGDGPVYHAKIRGIPHTSSTSIEKYILADGETYAPTPTSTAFRNAHIYRYEHYGDFLCFLEVAGTWDGNSRFTPSIACLYTLDTSMVVFSGSKGVLSGRMIKLTDLWTAQSRVDSSYAAMIAFTEDLDLSVYTPGDVPWAGLNFVEASITKVDYPGLDAICEQPTYNDWYACTNGLSFAASPYAKDSMADAYYMAMDNLPKSQMNLLETICDLVDIMSGFFDPILLPNSLSRLLGKYGRDAWFGYRYAYTTTLADIKDVMTAVERQYDLTQRGAKVLSTFGSCNGYHCEAKVKVSSIVNDDMHTLERIFAPLDLYDLWDLVPYSWIVDWILPIGDILGRWKTQRFAGSLDITELWYSYKIENSHGSIYYRFPMTGAPTSLGWLDYSPSRTTTFKRCIDTACLLYR